MKQKYLKPGVEVISLQFDEGLLQGSFNATTTSSGFTSQGTYSDDEWEIE